MILAGHGKALLDKEIMGTHYSTERLWSEEAEEILSSPISIRFQPRPKLCVIELLRTAA